MPKFLICGDIHGHIYHLLDLIQEIEDSMGLKLDAILQVGDMGAWSPIINRIDSPTQKFAQKDPGELDLRGFLRKNEQTKGLVMSRKWPRIWFVKGNHEDFEFLKSIGSGPIDPYEMIWYIPNGNTMVISGLTVGGLGGIYYRDDDEKKRLKPQYTQEIEIDVLRSGHLDILLTHDAPLDMPKTGAGSPNIRALMEDFAPRYVFSGHYHYPGRTKRFEFKNGVTEAVMLNQIHSIDGPCERFAGVLDNDGFNYIPKEIEDKLNAKWYEISPYYSVKRC